MNDLPHVDLDNSARQEEDDHDLLTYNESGARLAEEIRAVKADLETATGGARAPLEDRLALLVEAATRNTRWAAVDAHASSFLAYRGPGTLMEG